MKPATVTILTPIISKAELKALADRFFKPRLYFVEFHGSVYAVISQSEDLACFEVFELVAWDYAISHPAGHATIEHHKGIPYIEASHQALREERRGYSKTHP